MTSHAGSSKCSKQKRVARRDGGLGLAFARTPPLNSALELRSRRAPRTRALRARQPGHRAVLQPCVRVFCRQATACPEPPAGLRVFVLINNRDRTVSCFVFTLTAMHACIYNQLHSSSPSSCAVLDQSNTVFVRFGREVVLCYVAAGLAKSEPPLR